MYILKFELIWRATWKPEHQPSDESTGRLRLGPIHNPKEESEYGTICEPSEDNYSLLLGENEIELGPTGKPI